MARGERIGARFTRAAGIDGAEKNVLKYRQIIPPRPRRGIGGRRDMTQKELRDAGELYDANYDPELTRLLDACKDACHEYNAIRPSDWAAKDAKLRSFIGSVGAGVRVQAPFWCDYGANISFGDNFYANHNLVILDAAKVTFGRNVFVGPDCGFHTAGHPLDAARRNAGLEYAKPITVGDDVWFGAGVHVLPGVTIGSNVVIGAGAVVTKDIPSNSLALGVPARVMRRIGNDAEAAG